MVSGKLCASIIEARHVAAADLDAPLDFYVRLRLGGHEVVTDTCFGSTSPKFLKDVRMPVLDPDMDALQVDMLQLGMAGDLVVGSAKLPMSRIVGQGTVVHWLDLTAFRQNTGARLCCVLRYLPGDTMRAPTPPSFGVAARNARNAAMPDDALPGRGASGVLFSDEVPITAAALPATPAAASGHAPVWVAPPSGRSMVGETGAAVGPAAVGAPLGGAVQAGMAAGIMGHAGPGDDATTAEAQGASEVAAGGEPAEALTLKEVLALQLTAPAAAAGMVEAKEVDYRKGATEGKEEESAAQKLAVPGGPLAEEGVEWAMEGLAAEAEELDEVAAAGGAGDQQSQGGLADEDAMVDEGPSFVQTASPGDPGAVPGGVFGTNFTVKTKVVAAEAASTQAPQAADADAGAAPAVDDHAPCTPPLAPRPALASATPPSTNSPPAAATVVGCNALCGAGSASSCNCASGGDGDTGGSGRRRVVASAIACAAVCGQLAAAGGLLAIAALNARSRARFVATFGTSDVCLVGSCYDERSFRRFKARQAVWEA